MFQVYSSFNSLGSVPLSSPLNRPQIVQGHLNKKWQKQDTNPNRLPLEPTHSTLLTGDLTWSEGDREGFLKKMMLELSFKG